MNRKNPFIRILLSPIALIFNWATWIRNQLFEWELLPSKQFAVPVICIGNITIAGTGKTPLTAYLIALLKSRYRVATLSRGYKRNTKGFRIVDTNSTLSDAGDEACQIKQKFPDITVAVDENRRRGINKLLSLPEADRPNVILLDDAMQHRFVMPSLTIMLTDYQNLYYEDHILPVGNLRESTKGVYRADIIVVTKCVEAIKPIDLRIVEKNMSLMASQHLYFAKTKYHPLIPLFNTFDLIPCSLEEMRKEEELLLVAGIANPTPLIEKIKSYNPHLHVCVFPDHHPYSLQDIQAIDNEFLKMTSQNKRIITTEKDAIRLRTIAYLPEKWKPLLYYLPISVEFIFEQGENFDARVQNHVISTININKKNVKN